MAKKEDTRPRHQQIAASLRASIMSGDLEPGERLPTTQQLMERYGVTGQTVQRTLQVLKEEGFVFGRPGVGVFIRAETPLAVQVAAFLSPPPGHGPHPWMSRARERGQRGSAKLLEVTRTKPPRQVTQALDIDPDEDVVLRYQALSLDDEPVELAWNYYPLAIADGTPLERRTRIRGGSAALLTDLGYSPLEHVDRVSVRLATPEEFTALELPDDVPVLRTLRTVYSHDARPVEVSVLVKGGHRHELVYQGAIG